jgi:hypothetical protein
MRNVIELLGKRIRDDDVYLCSRITTHYQIMDDKNTRLVIFIYHGKKNGNKLGLTLD